LAHVDTSSPASTGEVEFANLNPVLAEADTEREVVSNDTDTNLPSLQSFDRESTDHESLEGSRSEFAEGDTPSSNSSVSHDEVAETKDAAELIGFDDGGSFADPLATQPAPVVSSMPKIENEGDGAGGESLPSRRPR